MYRFIATLLLVGIASQARADSCPNFYRFVEFGTQDSDGIVHRGGINFRGFVTEGTPLLIPENTICSTVEDLAKDGRKLPIPVVLKIDIDPQAADLNLKELQIISARNVAKLAEANAKAHREKLALTNSVSVRDQDYLCVSTNNSESVSCQVFSPYEDVIALIIYCDAQQCRMPVLGRGEHLVISAVWQREAKEVEFLGAEVTDKVQRIYGFLERQF